MLNNFKILDIQVPFKRNVPLPILSSNNRTKSLDQRFPTFLFCVPLKEHKKFHVPPNGIFIKLGTTKSYFLIKSTKQMQPQVGSPWFRSTCNEKTQIITINVHVLALAFYSFDEKVMETFCIKTRTIVFTYVPLLLHHTSLKLKCVLMNASMLTQNSLETKNVFPL